MGSRDRFTENAIGYNTYRPSFPPQLIDWIVAETGITPLARVADIGCGTGVATRLWTARGFDVTGVEPNEAMLEVARSTASGNYRRGDAESTGLPDCGFDLVSAAQAFHYFEVDTTLKEWQRILVPSGACAVYWYRIVPSRVKSAFRGLRDRYGSSSERYATRKRDIAATLDRRPEVTELQTATFPYEQWLDHDGWRGRVFASSRMHIPHGDSALDGELDAIFDLHQEQGRMGMPLEATAVIWRFG